MAFYCTVVLAVKVSGVVRNAEGGAGNAAVVALKWLNHVHRPGGQQGNISNTTA